MLSQLDATIVNVSLSSLATDLHANLSTIQWVTSGYLLALTLVLPLNGWLVDRIGAKALYSGCSRRSRSRRRCAGRVVGAVADRLPRAARRERRLLAPMAQMMIARVAGQQMARVIGYAAVPVLLAPILGPVVAGAILQHTSWRWLLVNLPVGVLALALAVRFLPGDRDDTQPRELDWVGLALLSPGPVLFLYGIERINEALGIAAIVAAALLLAAFLRVETRKGEHALIDLRLFRRRCSARPRRRSSCRTARCSRARC